jgi:hypothetical protein
LDFLLVSQFVSPLLLFSLVLISLYRVTLIGGYDKEDKAARAYDLAAQVLGCHDDNKFSRMYILLLPVQTMLLSVH